MQHKRLIGIIVILLLLSGSIIFFLLSSSAISLFNSTRDDWVIPESTNDLMRAIHLSGNWGENIKGFKKLPAGYFEWIRDLNVNWVGISVGLLVDSRLDSTVKRQYSGAEIVTIPDDVLRNVIRRLKKHGFHVYLTLAFQPENTLTSQYPLIRWSLGDPKYYEGDPTISKETWLWDPDHPDHERFVREFWKTYTDQAVHFAQIAEEEGVELYSLGTETENLFRTRTSGRFANDFADELKTMVSQVRSVYHGQVTYDILADVRDLEGFDEIANFLFSDLRLDVVGLSAYYRLVDTSPDNIMSVAELEGAWENIFTKHLVPFQEQNPGKPIVFTEYGYVDAIEAPFDPTIEAARNRKYVDANGNNLDDNEEVQANIYQAFFNVNERYGNLVKGVFLWSDYMTGKEVSRFDEIFGIRGKVAEDVIRTQYAKWK